MYRSIISNIQWIQQSLPKGKWIQRFFFLVELVFTLTTTFTQVYPIYEIPLTHDIGLVQDKIEDQPNHPSLSNQQETLTYSALGQLKSYKNQKKVELPVSSLSKKIYIQSPFNKSSTQVFGIQV